MDQLLKQLEKSDPKSRIFMLINEDDNELQALFIQLISMIEWLQQYGTLLHFDGTFKVNAENYLLYITI